MLSYSTVCDHKLDELRSGEASMVELKDGRLLLCFTRFQGGGSDESFAGIVRSYSADRGLTWSEPESLFHPPEGALNAMSVSLLRLDDGRIACVYLVKWSMQACIPQWTTSSDESTTWSEPMAMTTDPQYFSINNDRLVLLRDGTIVLPYAVTDVPERDIHDGKFPAVSNKRCGLFWSSDQGRGWHRSPHEITHTPEVFAPPTLCMDREHLHPDVCYLLDQRLGIFQEPGVVELRDGRLLMYMRSSYAIYRCFAENAFSEWKDCAPIEGYNVCCGPQSIQRDPLTDALILFYNDRGAIPFGAPRHSWRTPLSVAVSKDEAVSWERLVEIEDDRRNYCYYSVLFLKDRFVLSYYESANSVTAGGEEIRRNLASLKVCTGPADFFNQPVENFQ